MKIFSLETSTKNFSLAVSMDEKILAFRNFKLKKVLSSSIIPAIKIILKRTDTALADLDGFAIGLGPGSFTSLRVGLSTVKAFGAATGKPVVGIPSLDILAMNVPVGIADQICCLCDARRNLLYTCSYRRSGVDPVPLGDYSLSGIDDCLNKIKEPTFFIGDGISLYREKILARFKTKWASKIESIDDLLAKEKDWYPRADHLARRAYRRFLKKEYDSIDKIVPLYLYPEDCQVAAKDVGVLK